MISIFKRQKQNKKGMRQMIGLDETAASSIDKSFYGNFLFRSENPVACIAQTRADVGVFI